MRAHNGNAHAGAGDAQPGEMQDLAPLVLHFHFFIGIEIIEHAADERDDVERDLRGEYLRLALFATGERVHLALEFLKSALSGAGYGLIGARDHALDRREAVERADGHRGDDRGAVGIGNDAGIALRVLAVDLRHDERDGRIHAEGGAVVDVYRAAFHDGRGKRAGHAALYRAEDKVHALERGVRCFFHGKVLPAEGNFAPRAARAREELETRNGNIVFFQYVEHLAADRAGRAENGDIAVFHKRISFLSAGEPVIQYADRLFKITVFYAYNDGKLVRALRDGTDV